MSDDTTPTRPEVDALMKRCQRGVGGRDALDEAHSIMAECYGTLGALMLEVERLRAAQHTPNTSLPPLGDGPRRDIVVTVSVPANWESRLDMQWVLEREVHADRWRWNWPAVGGIGEVGT